MQEHERIFSAYLSGKDQKLTRNRKVILDAVFDLHEHFDADRLYAMVRGRGGDISLATVYRTLPLLLGAGLIQQCGRNDSREIYEHIYGHPKHVHWVCERCAAVLETDLDSIIPNLKKSAKQLNFQISDLKISVKGLCWKCQNNENENQ